MTEHELEHLIRSRIPLADFMQLCVLKLQPEQVLLSAPLEPNLNVHGTLFGGSGTAIALVAAWSLVHARMQALGPDKPLVVYRQSTKYFKPVKSAVQASAEFADPQAWSAFEAAVRQGERARLDVVVELRAQSQPDEIAARLEATFAA